MKDPKEYLVFPLDVNSLDEARGLIRVLGEDVGVFKVGLELFVSEGPTVVKEIKGSCQAKIFLDLKLNDIPATMKRALFACFRMGVDFVTIHPDEAGEALKTLGTEERMGCKLLGVTVLTSLNSTKLEKLGYRQEYCQDIAQLVAQRARVLLEAGVDGLVCSGHEIRPLRASFGTKPILFVPGIRPSWSMVTGDDQKRVMTPGEAIRAGADYIVIGRPIRDASDPKGALKAVIKEIGEALAC